MKEPSIMLLPKLSEARILRSVLKSLTLEDDPETEDVIEGFIADISLKLREERRK